MKIDGKPYRSVWVDEDGWTVRIFDQTKLPWALEVLRLADEAQAAHAIRSMQVRGAPLIGAVAAYGVALALRRNPSTANLDACVAMLGRTRPTAVNLAWALGRMRAALHQATPLPPAPPAEVAQAPAVGFAEPFELAFQEVPAFHRLNDGGLVPLVGGAQVGQVPGALQPVALELLVQGS